MVRVSLCTSRVPGGRRLRSAPFQCYLFARVSRGWPFWKSRESLFVIVTGDEIVVTSDAGFRAAYAEGLIIRSSLSDGAPTRTTMR